eukprot:10332373-Prorocentrum_lima.AAC.1
MASLAASVTKFLFFRPARLGLLGLQTGLGVGSLAAGSAVAGPRLRGVGTPRRNSSWLAEGDGEDAD